MYDPENGFTTATYRLVTSIFGSLDSCRAPNPSHDFVYFGQANSSHLKAHTTFVLNQRIRIF